MPQSPDQNRLRAVGQISDARLYATWSEPGRHTMVTLLLATARHMGFGDGSDDEICSAAGYSGIAEYWEIALSEPMTIGSFAHLLYIFSINPQEHAPEERVLVDDNGNIHKVRVETNNDQKTRLQIDAALRLAQQAKEPFFVGDDMLRPREAVEWLMRMPKRRAILPKSLLQLFTPAPASQGEKSKSNKSKGRPGPKATLRENIADAMLRDLRSGRVTPEVLNDYTLEALRAAYGGSQNTANSARKLALARFSEFKDFQSSNSENL
jgi:hypothetical protein